MAPFGRGKAKAVGANLLISFHAIASAGIEAARMPVPDTDGVLFDHAPAAQGRKGVARLFDLLGVQIFAAMALTKATGVGASDRSRLA